MKTFIQVYNILKQKVLFLYQRLNLKNHEPQTGRPLNVPVPEIISMALFKQTQQIETKKSLYEIFQPDCSYHRFVENLNRFARLAMIIFAFLLNLNRAHAHPVKHTDSTDVPVSTLRKAGRHKTLAGLAQWGKTGKGWFYGLKLHITTDLKRRILAVRFTGGNVDDRRVVIKLNKGLFGVFVADAGYISASLAREFHEEHRRVLLVKPRANMKKLMTEFQHILYGTRMKIELSFRSLKMFFGLVTSLPRSVNGYLATWTYSLVAYLLAA